MLCTRIFWRERDGEREDLIDLITEVVRYFSLIYDHRILVYLLIIIITRNSNTLKWFYANQCKF